MSIIYLEEEGINGMMLFVLPQQKKGKNPTQTHLPKSSLQYRVPSSHDAQNPTSTQTHK